MDLNSSDTGGASEHNKANGINDSHVESEPNTEAKNYDEVDSIATAAHANGAPEAKDGFDHITGSQDRQRSQSVRFDRNGHKITTQIGQFSLASLSARANSVKAAKRDANGRRAVNTSNVSAGTGEGQGSPSKEDKTKRHRVTFMDEVTNDKTMIIDV